MSKRTHKARDIQEAITTQIALALKGDDPVSVQERLTTAFSDATWRANLSCVEAAETMRATAEELNMWATEIG